MRISEDCGLPEISIAEAAGRDPVPSAEQLGAFILANLDILLRRFDLLLVYWRSHVVLLVDASPYLRRLGAAYEFVGKLVVNAFLHDDATGSSAALTGCAETSPKCAIDRQVYIGII